MVDALIGVSEAGTHAKSTPPAVGPTLHAYSHERPLILLTDYSAETQGGGAVILRSLLGAEDRKRVVWMTIEPSARGHSDGFETISLQEGSAGRIRKRRRSLGLDQTIFARDLAEEAIRVAQQRGAKAFWVVLHGAAVQVTNRIARRHAFPIHATVHDDPAFANALRSKRYIGLVPWIDSQFNETLGRANSVDVISEPMGTRYRKLLGVESLVVHRGLAEPVQPSPDYNVAKNGLRIGVLGSTYSFGQLPKLGWAVARASKELGVRGRILVIGRSHGERLKSMLGDAADVEVTGHISEEEGIAKLRDCFALYLNYPFAKRDVILRQTSFPTKLSTYIQAARPLVLHVPDDSSVMPLLQESTYTRHWNSLHASEGAAEMVNLWNQAEVFQSHHEAAERIRRTYFDRDQNRSRLFGALNALVSTSETSS